MQAFPDDAGPIVQNATNKEAKLRECHLSAVSTMQQSVEAAPVDADKHAHIKPPGVTCPMPTIEEDSDEANSLPDRYIKTTHSLEDAIVPFEEPISGNSQHGTAEMRQIDASKSDPSQAEHAYGSQPLVLSSTSGERSYDMPFSFPVVARAAQNKFLRRKTVVASSSREQSSESGSATDFMVLNLVQHMDNVLARQVELSSELRELIARSLLSA